MQGKTLRYEHCDEKTRAGLDASRAKEWKKWLDFGASVKIQGKVLEELLNEGHKLVPTQWVEQDKGDNTYKSRLVACGQLETDRKKIRSDSPTCPLEAFNLIASFAACNRLTLKCADLANAYFQGEKMDRLLLLKPPRGGLPGEEDNGYMLAANMPIYGTGDSGRKFYKGFRAEAMKVGFRECRFARSCYVYEVNGDIKVMMGAHVDDDLWAAKPGYEFVMDNLKAL